MPAGSNKNSLLARVDRVPALRRTFRGNGVPNIIRASLATFVDDAVAPATVTPGDTVDLVAFSSDYAAAAHATLIYEGPVSAPAPGALITNADLTQTAEVAMLARPLGSPDPLGTTVPAGGIEYGEQAQGVEPVSGAPWRGTLMGFEVPDAGFRDGESNPISPAVNVEAHFHNGVAVGFQSYQDPADQGGQATVLPVFVTPADWSQALADSDTLPTVVDANGVTVLIVGLWSAVTPTP